MIKALGLFNHVGKIIRRYKHYVIVSRFVIAIIIAGTTAGLLCTFLLSKQQIKAITTMTDLNHSHHETPMIPQTISPNKTYHLDLSLEIQITQPNITISYPTIKAGKKTEELVTEQISMHTDIPIYMKSSRFVTLTINIAPTETYIYQFLPSQITGVENSLSQVITGFFIYYNSLPINKELILYTSTASNHQFYVPNWNSQEPKTHYSKQNYFNLDFSIDFASNIMKWVLLSHYDYQYVNQDGDVVKRKLQMVKGGNHATIKITNIFNKPIPNLKFDSDPNFPVSYSLTRYAGLLTSLNFGSGAITRHSMHPDTWKIKDTGFTDPHWHYWNFAFAMEHNSKQVNRMYLNLNFNNVSKNHKYILRIAVDSKVYNYPPYDNFFDAILEAL